MSPTSTETAIEATNERLGSWFHGGRGTCFKLWAPKAQKAEVLLVEGNNKRPVAMEKREKGYFELWTKEAKPGTRYFYRLNNDREIPDPVSRFQPEGVHGPSEVTSPEFRWNDAGWKGIDLREMVIYEIHVGTFTDEGTFDAAIKKLPYLKDLGVNALEIMPVAQFAGKRNWGYDGVGLYAAQNSYGGPEGLKRLVNACHEHGIAAILDVVYNHMGPEGNYLSAFGPYFQSKYHTPWGDALNYDGEWSDEVRRFFLGNARQWLEDFHFDGLRLDAVHAILDTSAKSFLEELGDLKRALESKTGRKLYLIAESESNDPRLLKHPEQGGIGLDGHWADDLHHVIHTLVTGENGGYYADYGKIEQLAKIFKTGLLFDGDWSEARHRKHGRSYDGVERMRLVVCAQNHDQIGNRMMGERLSTLVSPEKLRLAAACYLLSPGLPLVFMGEEYAETAPFQYFIDHTDKNLVEAVRKGRKEEFSGFAWQGEPPDPAGEKTFKDSTLKWDSVETNPAAKSHLEYYRQLFSLSKWIRRERLFEQGNVTTETVADGNVLAVRGSQGKSEIQVFFSFSKAPQKVAVRGEPGTLEIALKSWDHFVSPTTPPSKNLAVQRSIESAQGEITVEPYSAIVLRRS